MIFYSLQIYPVPSGNGDKGALIETTCMDNYSGYGLCEEVCPEDCVHMVERKQQKYLILISAVPNYFIAKVALSI